MVCIICAGCGQQYRPSEPTRLGLIELKKLCEKDAGLTVYETVEADGYYDDVTKCHHCWIGLINSPFEYIEYCDHESKRSPLTYVLKEHGCYRLTKVKRDSGQCHEDIDKKIAKRVTEPSASFKEEQCVEVDSIDKPSLGAGLFLDKDEKLILKDNFEISRYEYTIQSADNGQKYGQFINYSLVVKTVGGAGYSCGSSAVIGERVSVKNPSFYKAFISKVIKHKNKEM